MTSTLIPKRSCQISAPFTMVNVSFITIYYIIIIYTCIEFRFLKRYFHTTLSPFLQFSKRLFLTSGQANCVEAGKLDGLDVTVVLLHYSDHYAMLQTLKNINRNMMSKRVRQVTCNPISSVLIKKHSKVHFLQYEKFKKS